MLRGLTIPAETIFCGVAVTVGIAALNPRLNMDYPLSGIIACPHCMCGGRPPSRPYSYAM